MDGGKWWSHRECDDHPVDACDACRLFAEGEWSAAYQIALAEDEWVEASSHPSYWSNVEGAE